MSRKRAIFFYVVLAGIPLFYVLWSARPFFLPPRIVLNPSRITNSAILGSDDHTRRAAMPVITTWVRRAAKYRPEVYGAQKFTLKAFWSHLKNPYLQPRTFTVDGLGPNLSVSARGESASFQLINGQWEWAGVSYPIKATGMWKKGMTWVETPEIHYIQEYGIPENPMARMLWGEEGSAETPK